MMREPRFIPAYWPISWFLKRNEFWAIPNPFTRTVYCLPEHIDDQRPARRREIDN